ncbi:MAG: M1 family metallopeptidase, partial [Chitinophagales bacterium]
MQRLLSLFLLIICTTLVNAQKPTEPFSCYSTKSHFHKNAAAANEDLRSDTIDIKHTVVHLDMTNWSGRTFTAQADVTYEVLAAFSNEIKLDLLGLTVDSVKMNGNQLTYSHNDTLIDITTPSLVAGDEATVEVYYHGQPVQNGGDWGGFYWNSTYAYNVGVSFLEDPHNYGRVWFPCFDNFVERNTFEYFITTDDTRKAFCNGLLQNETDNGDGTTTWHWAIAQNIPSYLASVAVADYETIEMDYNGIPIQLAVRAADSTNLKNSFVHLPDAMQAFEEGYGDYVFDRVGYCVTNFGSGAMEHATNITYMRAAVNGNTQWETLMAHELAHHWWGDNITCRTDDDMWINEGWATYSEALFTEAVYGTDAYKDYIRENHESVLRTLHINDDGYHPVAGVTHDLVYSSTVYDKGGDMAHTLRGVIGDYLFFSCIDGFMTAYKFEDVSTDDMMNYFSDCSGMDLSSFFDTWIKEAGFHHYSISTLETIDNGNGTYSVEGTIKQKLRENNSYTTFMPIEITYMSADFEVENHTAFIYGECSSFSIELPFEPVFVAVDLDEKISDATVDNYQTINTIGTYDFD